MRTGSIFTLLFLFFATTVSLRAINPETDYNRKLESISTEGDNVERFTIDGEYYFLGYMINYSLIGSDDVDHAIQVVWA